MSNNNDRFWDSCSEPEFRRLRHVIEVKVWANWCWADSSTFNKGIARIEMSLSVAKFLEFHKDRRQKESCLWISVLDSWLVRLFRARVANEFCTDRCFISLKTFKYTEEKRLSSSWLSKTAEISKFARSVILDWHEESGSSSIKIINPTLEIHLIIISSIQIVSSIQIPCDSTTKFSTDYSSISTLHPTLRKWLVIKPWNAPRKPSAIW